MRFGSFLLLLVLALSFGACRDATPGDESSRASAAIGPALVEAFRQQSRLDRIDGLTTALGKLDAGNIEEAKKAYEFEHWWLGDMEIENFMEAWTRFDADAALDYAGRWPERARRPTALSAVIRAWSLRDPEAASEAIKPLGAAYPKVRQKFIENLLTGWTQSGKPGLIEYVAAQPEASYPIFAMWIAGGQTRRLGVPAVLDWVDGIVAGELPEKLQMNVFRRVTGMASRLDPGVVGAWVAKHGEQGYTSEAPRILIERWVTLDPEAAMDWVDVWVPEADRRAMLRTAFTKWVTQDIEGAGSWIESAPSADRYDPAFRAYAVVLAQRSGEKAMPYAERILDEESRRVTLKRVAASWYRRDAVAAETWLQASELDEEARSDVRRAPGQKRVSPLKES